MIQQRCLRIKFPVTKITPKVVLPGMIDFLLLAAHNTIGSTTPSRNQHRRGCTEPGTAAPMGGENRRRCMCVLSRDTRRVLTSSRPRMRSSVHREQATQCGRVDEWTSGHCCGSHGQPIHPITNSRLIYTNDHVPRDAATNGRTDGRTQRTNRNPHATDVSHCIRACVRGPWRDGVLPQSRDIDAFDLSTDRPIF